MTARQILLTAGSLLLSAAGCFAAQAPREASIEVVHNWSPLGTATFTDDIMTGIWFFDCETYEVPVEYDTFNTGWYRLVNPLQYHPLLDYMISDGGEFPTDKDYYLVIDASDPENVKIPMGEIGYSDEDGAMSFCSLSAEWANLGYSESEVEGMGGKLIEGTITFTEPYSCRNIQNGHTYYANESGELKIVLPGGTDYGISFNILEGFCPDDDCHYHVQINTGATVPTLKWGVFDEVTEENALSLAAGGETCQPGATVDIDLSDFSGRKAYVIALTLDSSATPRESVYTVLYNPADNSADWEYYCNGKFTDGILVALSGENIEEQPVTVQQHVSRPGYFRVVDPYAGWNFEDMEHLNHNHHHYIYLDATDPENVILEDSPVGVGGGFYGDFLVNSTYNSMLLAYGKDLLDEYGYMSGGTYADNLITFDTTAELLLYPTEFMEWYPSDTATFFVLEMMPEDPTVGVDAIIGATNAEALYFNLQGQRVDNPEAGIYIKVSEGKTEKIVRK